MVADLDATFGRTGTPQRQEEHMTVITHIGDLQALARRRVPRMFYDYVDSGSWTETTYRANTDDLASIRLR